MSERTIHPAPHGTHTLRLVLVTIALFILLALTVLFAKIGLGEANMPVALAISAAKAILIGLYFMGLVKEKTTARLFAAVAFLWLALLLAGSLADSLTRNF